MTERTAMQIKRMKEQTIGVEVEMNSITRRKAAKTAAEFFGTGRYEDTAGRNGYSTWSAWDADGREWKFQKDVSIAGPDEQKCELEAALAAARLKEDLGLTKEHILFFLHSFTNMDYDDQACKKRLIKTFVNSVYVYDDKVVLTFNYSGDDRTITLQEIDAGLPYGVCLPRAVFHQNTN